MNKKNKIGSLVRYVYNYSSIVKHGSLGIVKSYKKVGVLERDDDGLEQEEENIVYYILWLHKAMAEEYEEGMKIGTFYSTSREIEFV